MRVLVLCGGIGTRMKEETEFKPKPMVPIGERPILWHIMKHYAHFGHQEFVLALGYRGEMIKEYFLNYEYMQHDITLYLGPRRKDVRIHDDAPLDQEWTVTLSDTGQKALKGARIKRCQHYLQHGCDDDTFLMTYGDGVANVDLDDLIAFHRSHGKLMTVTGVIPTMRFGELKTRDDGAVDFSEKAVPGAAKVNGGYYVISHKVFDLLTDDDDCDFEIGPMEQIAAEGELMMYHHHGFWHCMDTLRDVEALNQMWEKGEQPWFDYNRART